MIAALCPLSLLKVLDKRTSAATVINPPDKIIDNFALI